MPDFPSSTSASGIWQMRQVKRAVQGGNWPPIAIPDPYFEYVSLLLPGDGTNGAQNNTFLDSSTNNFTITRNGNTTQGTFTPYGLNWSNYFNNSTGLGLAYGTATHSFWNNNFTLEFWVNCPTKSFAAVISSWFDSNFGGGSWQLAITTGVIGLSNFQSSGTNQGSFITSGSTRVDDGLWHHVAVTQVTGANKTFRLFVDGVLRGYKVENNWTQSAANSTIYIGNQGPGTFDEANRYMLGYLSNLRLTTSVVADYATSSTTLGTTVFTPPTAPLSVTAGTNILTCADNRFVDDSTNNFAITRLGDVSVQRFSPFNPTAAYSASTIGGSGYFDGAGDFLTAPANAAYDFGTGNFTVEFWFNRIAPVGQSFHDSFIGNRPSGYSSGMWHVYVGPAANDPFSWQARTPAGDISLSGGTCRNGEWNHIAVVRNGNTITLYINGTSVNSISTTTSIGNSSSAISIGAFTDGAYPCRGYFSSVRLVKGTAVYTSNFTPSTTPLTAISNTSLLTNFTNAGIIDNAMMNNLETVGNAQISTAQSKFGGGSMAFDGSGDYLKLSNNTAAQALGFGTGNFTIECWVYPTTSAAANNGIYDCRYSASATGPLLYNIPASGLYMFYNGANVITGSNPTINTWSHIALVRSSGVTKLYLNGVQTGSNYTDTNNYTSGSNSGAVGAFYDGSASFNGYIDDLRITRGFARYTSNFSVPTAPFPTQ